MLCKQGRAKDLVLFGPALFHFRACHAADNIPALALACHRLVINIPTQPQESFS